MNKDSKKTTKRDLLLIAGILVLAGVLYLGNRILNQKPAQMVEVTVNGAVVETLDLSKDADVVINGANGGTNRLVISQGTVSIQEATCPDKVCIHQGKISRTGELIVCLPNQMIAKIVGEE